MGFWYTFFDVEDGQFGILAKDGFVYRTALPCVNSPSLQIDRLVGISGAKFDRWLLKSLQKRVSAYFAGSCEEFENVDISLEGVSEFGVTVLLACKNVRFGQTVSYGELAKMAGRKQAFRAVGAVLGTNPVPLIVPCHRVIKSDGSIGGFMRGAAGGVDLKKRMLEMENSKVRKG